MKYKSTRKALTIAIALALLLAALTLATVAWADELGQRDLDMSDSAGNRVTEPGLSSVGEFSTVAGALGLAPSIRPPSLLARQDYQAVYDEARALLDIGVHFRTHEIQVVPSGTITEALQNYQDFNAGTLFYGFCSDYDQIDAQGCCPEGDDVRNALIRARELFAFLSLAEPANVTLQAGNARQVGRAGVLTATREIANVHLIFGNEFLVDALDYRFSAGALPNADVIIQQEIDQLNLALQQFTLAVDVLAHAFNADFGGPWGAYIGDYFTAREFELFGIVSERMVMTMDEVANRYRQLGQNEEALALYARGSSAQYVQVVALAHKAVERDADFLDNGGWEMMTNLGRLRAMAQAVHDGLNPFGFTDKYVPVHTYSELFNVTQQQFLRDATEDEIAAREAQREFDHNATALNQELQSLRLTYDNQLLDLCGESDDDYQTCDGGLMEQSYYAMSAAARRMQLADQRLAHVLEQIRIEQDRADQVIEITLEGGDVLSATSYLIGVRNSMRGTGSIVASTTDEWHTGVERNKTKSIQGTLGFPPSFGIGISGSASKSTYSRENHSQSTTTSFSFIWDPAQKEIGRLNGLRDVQQAATQAGIAGANSEATIRNLLLQQADLMIELDIAIDEWNRLSADHNHLVEKYRNLLNLRAQAQANMADSYLNDPAYRILRDTLTVEAARSHGLAAQFAYLTTKALEYEFLTPAPFMGDIFKARTADDVDNYLLQLEQWRLALGSPGYRNRYPYSISIAQDLLGLSDQNLDPDGDMTPAERAQLRYELLQEFLQARVVSGTLEFQFTTSLLDNNIFSSNVWNNRIAGVGLPAEVPGTAGLSINVLTRQFGDVGTPEIVLTHGGQASYRTVTGDIVEYTPGPTMLVGYVVPQDFMNKNTTAVIICSVNGNGQGTPNSALFNLSVAASSWTLRIDSSSYYNRNLDISQIEDIVLEMDSTGIALPGRAAAARMDALKLQAEFDGTPLRSLPDKEY